VYHRAVDLLEADINDEMVGLDPSRGSCFGLNTVAKDVWRRLEQPQTFDQLRSGLLAEYDVSEEQCTAELQEFLTEMTAKGLIAGGPVSRNQST
jgi:hypothetical protein